MAKSKGKVDLVVSKPSRTKSARSEFDLLGEDGWVVVKKQRVTILIPPLDRERDSTDPTTEVPLARTVNGKSQVEREKNSQLPSGAGQNRASRLVSSAGATKLAVASTSSHQVLPQNRGGDNVGSVSKAQNVPVRPGHTSAPHHFQQNSDNPRRANREHVLGMSTVPKTVTQSKRVYGRVNSIDRNTLINQRLRMLLLEQKLENAGGLSRWLVSIGLGQFVRIFHERSMSKFQLVNLTMSKLKDMGAYAVGPRRKLIHAIDSICQPSYCFKSC